MTAVKDLTFTQLASVLGGNSKVFLGEDPDGNIGVLISVTAVNGEGKPTLESEGVVKFLMRLRNAAHSAQTQANAAVDVTEQLAAFNSALSESSVEDGYVIQTGSIRAAIDVASATTVVGPTTKQ